MASESLDFSRHDPADGLCIGFGWEGVAEPGSASLAKSGGFCDGLWAREGTGTHLAQVINAIGALAPERKVDVLAHSLGARIALRALPQLERGNLGRVILLGAAEFESEALQMLAANTANRQAEFINVTARENDPFDLLFECFAPRRVEGDRALSAGAGL